MQNINTVMKSWNVNNLHMLTYLHIVHPAKRYMLWDEDVHCRSFSANLKNILEQIFTKYQLLVFWEKLDYQGMRTSYSWFCFIQNNNFLKDTHREKAPSNETKYSRMDQVKFVEDNLQKNKVITGNTPFFVHIVLPILFVLTLASNMTVF